MERHAGEKHRFTFSVTELHVQNYYTTNDRKQSCPHRNSQRIQITRIYVLHNLDDKEKALMKRQIYTRGYYENPHSTQLVTKNDEYTYS